MWRIVRAVGSQPSAPYYTIDFNTEALRGFLPLKSVDHIQQQLEKEFEKTKRIIPTPEYLYAEWNEGYCELLNQIKFE